LSGETDRISDPCVSDLHGTSLRVRAAVEVERAPEATACPPADLVHEPMLFILLRSFLGPPKRANDPV
jgi:hypothetical protein